MFNKGWIGAVIVAAALGGAAAVPRSASAREDWAARVRAASGPRLITYQWTRNQDDPLGAAVRRAAEISNQPFSALEGRQHLLDFFRSQNVHVVPAPGRGGVYHVWAPDPHNPDGLRFRGEVGNFPSFPWGGDLAAIQRQLQVIADAVKNTINDDAPLETSTHRKAEFNVTIDCAGQPDCAARAYAAVANGGMNGNAAFTMEPQDGGLRYRTQPHAGTMVGDVGNHESTRLTLVEGGIDAIVYGKAGDASIVPIRDKNAPKPESE